MATVVRMPSVMAGSSEAALAKWLVAVGDTVAVGDPLAEVETEKAMVEYQAEIAGTVGRLVVTEGASVDIGAPIAVFIAAGEGDAEINAALGADAPAPAAAPATEPAAQPASSSAAEAVTVVTVPAAEPSPETAVVVLHGSGNRVFASPIARKIARERGIDLAAIAGTGPGGRIVRGDVEHAVPAPAAAPAPESAPAARVAHVAQSAHAEAAEPMLIPHTPMRKAIARRLTESKQSIPHFHLRAECQVDELLRIRSELNLATGLRISVNDFVIKAVANAFLDVPDANVTWSDEGMWKYDSVDIASAVATDGGLLTPVLRGAHAKSVAQISAEVRELASRARDKRLRQDELEGGSFSISNLGMYGTGEFAAIINPPHSGILAVGAAEQKPVVRDGELAVGNVMTVSLSADHRAVDGALAAQWLAAFQRHIESPWGLLV
ncbi:MAG: pyruvate dehydrogenase complex dihydrolipoamide acetyltransferase [Agromyces sp.]